jgi:hypothetical protein
VYAFVIAVPVLTLCTSVPCSGDPKPAPATSYVEFDFAPLPQNGNGKIICTAVIHTADKDISLKSPVQFHRPCDPVGAADGFASFLNNNKFKAEAVEKTKVRVYGRIWNDKLIPATKGEFTSPDLLPNELPTVKNAEKKG